MFIQHILVKFIIFNAKNSLLVLGIFHTSLQMLCDILVFEYNKTNLELGGCLYLGKILAIPASFHHTHSSNMP